MIRPLAGLAPSVGPTSTPARWDERLATDARSQAVVRAAGAPEGAALAVGPSATAGVPFVGGLTVEEAAEVVQRTVNAVKASSRRGPGSQRRILVQVVSE